MPKGKSKTPKGGSKAGAPVRDPGGKTEKKLKKGKK
jgi:hypothetical protein